MIFPPHSLCTQQRERKSNSPYGIDRFRGGNSLPELNDDEEDEAAPAAAWPCFDLELLSGLTLGLMASFGLLTDNGET